ncbi:MAG: DUF2849 domain-containing protein, partial [Pseudomonadota bacterium]
PVCGHCFHAETRLGDGAVVYLDADGDWVEPLADAALLQGDAADEALARAETREKEIVGAYLIDVEPGGAASGQKWIRETIRGSGPTVRPDLHKPDSVGLELG